MVYGEGWNYGEIMGKYMGNIYIMSTPDFAKPWFTN